MKRLEGRIAMITGSGSGMGRASALTFAAEGAHVLVVDLNGDAAEATAEEIRQDGGQASGYRCDVSDVASMHQLFDEVERDHGLLHVLYSHVGIPGAAGVDGVTEDDWNLSIDVNMKSAFFSAQLALPLLRKADGKGSIIFTASTTGIVGSPFSPLYSMAKGGVVNFGRALAVHTATQGVRVNVICPGPIDTPMLPIFFGRPGTRGETHLDDELQGFIANAVPMQRPGTPDEIATAALFFASDDSSFVTGAVLPVDGGFTAR